MTEICTGQELDSIRVLALNQEAGNLVPDEQDSIALISPKRYPYTPKFINPLKKAQADMPRPYRIIQLK